MSAVLAGALGLLVGGCTSDAPDSGNEDNIINPGGRSTYEAPALSEEQLATGEKINAKGFEIFANLYDVSEDDVAGKNVMMSPWNATTFLSILLNGADEELKSEILTQMGIGSMEELNSYNKVMAEYLPQADSKVLAKFPGAFFNEQTAPVSEGFGAILDKYYGVDRKSVDLKSEAGSNAVNAWANEQSEGAFPAVWESWFKDNFFLATMLHFRGRWKNSFDGPTEIGSFHNADGTVTSVPMMNKEFTTNVWVREHYQKAELEYGNGAYSMILILPREGFTPQDILQEEGLNLMDETSERYEVLSQILNITLPKFNLSTRIEYMRAAYSLSGFEKLVDENYDYSAMGPVGNPGPDGRRAPMSCYTDISVDENGTEIKSITFTGRYTSPGPSMEMIFDKPFIAVVREKTSKTLLFAGVINKLGN